MAIIIPPNGRTISRNSHLPERVRRTIAAVTPIIQQQNIMSLQVSSYPVFIYQRMNSGHVCSCSFENLVSPSAALYDSEGHAASSVMLSITEQANYGIETYNPETPSNNYATQVTVQPNNVMDEGTLIEGDTEFDMHIENNLGNNNSGACNVCQNTGFKGGYHFFQGMRYILDMSDISDQYGVEIDRTESPYKIKFNTEDAWVSFKVSLPLVSNAILPVAILWNNHSRVQGKAGPNPIVTVKPANLAIPEYNLGQGVKSQGICTLTLKANNFTANSDQVVAFTHLEVQLPLMTKPTYADIPNLVRSYDAKRVSPYTSATFTLPPNVPMLSPKDVISDMVHGVHWVVTMSHPITPSIGSIWSQEVDVRPLEPHETMSSLIMPHRSWLPYGGHDKTPSGLPLTRIGGY